MTTKIHILALDGVGDMVDETGQSKIIESCIRHKEFVVLDDGFECFWIDNRGAMSAWNLRVIADELDRRNQPLIDDMNSYFEKVSDFELNKEEYESISVL